jgi:hypothetical protein
MSDGYWVCPQHGDIYQQPGATLNSQIDCSKFVTCRKDVPQRVYPWNEAKCPVIFYHIRTGEPLSCGRKLTREVR